MNMIFIDEFIKFLETGQISSSEISKNKIELVSELTNSLSIDLELVNTLKNITFSELTSDSIQEQEEESTGLFKNTRFPYSNFIKNYSIILDKIPASRGRYAYI